MKLNLQRDSICFADDVSAPHEMILDIDKTISKNDFIKLILKYLPVAEKRCWYGYDTNESNLLFLIKVNSFENENKLMKFTSFRKDFLQPNDEIFINLTQTKL